MVTVAVAGKVLVLLVVEFVLHWTFKLPVGTILNEKLKGWACKDPLVTTALLDNTSIPWTAKVEKSKAEDGLLFI